MTRALALVCALALLLAGCAAVPSLPEGVSVTVFQTRFDGALHQVQLRVTNDGDTPLTVTRATLESSRFAEPAVFERAQVVPAGSARDLPVVLGSPACDGEPVRDAATLEFERPDGSSGSATVTLEDTGILAAIEAQDCLELAVARHADIAPPAVVLWTPGAGAPATLDFAITPTGADGSLTIASAGDTPLLGLVTPGGERVPSLEVDVVVDESTSPVLLRLRIEPARCDPHAIAEDKQGTLFPFDVDTSEGRSGRIVVAVDDEVRSSIYSYVADYCGLPY